MKKIIACLFAAILMISVMAPAFAKPVAKCSHCDGELISITDTGWVQKSETYVLMFMPITYYWQERTITVKCTNGVHTETYTKDRFSRPGPAPTPILA